MFDSKPSPTEQQNDIRSRGQRPIRWWPAAVILLAAIGAFAVLSSLDALNRQERNIQTAQVGIITFFLLLLWSILFSRFNWRIRVSILGAVLGLVFLSPALLRIRGVTGDLLPVLEWRWQRPAGSAIELHRKSDTRESTPPSTARTVKTARDYPQFLGPLRNATVDGPVFARDWKKQPPQQIWRRPVGPAWSGFSISGSYAITQEQAGESEIVVCYHLMSGTILWSHADNAHYHTTIAGEGPRTTPTIVSERLYTLGATGILNCLELATGKRIWWKNIILENQSEPPEWGMSGSPLVIGNMVVVSAGGLRQRSLVAYAANTGDLVWGSGTDAAGYSSPCLATIAGVPQILIFNANGMAAHEVQGGKILWEYPWPAGHPHVAIPVILPQDRVLISSGYGIGSELLQLQKDGDGRFSASKIWKSLSLKAKFTNVIYRDGYIYGLDDGILVCVDAANGKRKWKEGRYGHGQIILAGNLLIVMSEKGDVVLVEPVPEEHRELARFSALESKTWNPPALAGEYLLVRNDKEAACYRLPTISTPKPVAKTKRDRSAIQALPHFELGHAGKP
jgi:outer membrane protein assembly factor BamB